jgi:hypothetical protein
METALPAGEDMTSIAGLRQLPAVFIVVASIALLGEAQEGPVEVFDRQRCSNRRWDP